MVGVNHKRDIKIEELIIFNQTIRGMWSVIISAKKKNVIRYREEMTKQQEEKKIPKSQETSKSINITDKKFDKVMFLLL